MLPGKGAIRDELRREAAQVSIPEDMWDRINAELEQERVREGRRRRWIEPLASLKPVLAVAMATGAFGLLLTTVPGPSGSGPADGLAPVDVAALRPPKDNLRAGYFVWAGEQASAFPSEKDPVRTGRVIR